MTIYHYAGIIALLLLLVWAAGSYLVIRNIEEPAYTLSEKKDGYEIREYAAYIIAETEVTGEYDDTTSNGFRVIADYIFGNNTSQAGIAMTAPVLESDASESSSENIAMTVPVLDSKTESGARKIAFVLPSEYTLDTLPKPNNPQVTITPVDGYRAAVLRFGWYATEKRIAAKKAQLVSLLERDGFEIAGDIQAAFYNPPLSLPLLLRNEIIIPIR